MTAKSIVQVEVDDTSFKDYVALFNEYRAQLAQIPAGWAKVEKATEALAEATAEVPDDLEAAAEASEDIVSHFADMTASLMAQAELHRRIAATERTADIRAKRERDEEKKADKEREKAAAKYQVHVDRTNRTIKETRQNVASIAGGIASAATDVLKWVGIGGIAGGLVGGGGLFGLDRLAGVAGQNRRSAQGLDTTTGNEQAFALNYGRLVDPQSYLSNIENVARTPGLQYGVGAQIAQMSSEGKDTAQIGADLIPIIKQAFAQYGANSYGLQASGLDNVISLQDAIRIAGNSDSDIRGFRGGFEHDRSSLATSDQINKSWQDLDKQLGFAGQKIEQVLINDLSALAPVIDHLSSEAVELVDKWTKELVPAVDELASYLDSLEFKHDLKDAADDVKAFGSAAKEAAYTLGLITRPGSDPGETSTLGDIGRATGLVARHKPDPAIESNRTILQWNIRHPDDQVPYGPGNPGDIITPRERQKLEQQPFDPLDARSYSYHKPGTAPWDSITGYKTPDEPMATASGTVPGIGNDPAKVNPWLYGSPGTVPGIGNEHALGATEAPGRPEDWEKLHNPGDLFVPGSKTQMLGFSSDLAGIRGLRDQLLIYGKRDHLDTIEGIIGKYAPPGQNDTETYIKNAAKRTGFSRDEHLDLNDNDVAAKLISAITKQEHNRSNYSAATVVTILNQTGGSAVVSTSQLAQ